MKIKLFIELSIKACPFYFILACLILLFLLLPNSAIKAQSSCSSIDIDTDTDEELETLIEDCVIDILAGGEDVHKFAISYINELTNNINFAHGLSNSSTVPLITDLGIGKTSTVGTSLHLLSNKEESNLDSNTRSNFGIEGEPLVVLLADIFVYGGVNLSILDEYFDDSYSALKKISVYFGFSQLRYNISKINNEVGDEKGEYLTKGFYFGTRYKLIEAENIDQDLIWDGLSIHLGYLSTRINIDYVDEDGTDDFVNAEYSNPISQSIEFEGVSYDFVGAGIVNASWIGVNYLEFGSRVNTVNFEINTAFTFHFVRLGFGIVSSRSRGDTFISIIRRGDLLGEAIIEGEYSDDSETEDYKESFGTYEMKDFEFTLNSTESSKTYNHFYYKFLLEFIYDNAHFGIEYIYRNSDSDATKLSTRAEF